jgi:hypothetical protein
LLQYIWQITHYDTFYLRWLLETILKDFAALDSRVRADTEIQRLQEQKMLQERLKRVEKLREARQAKSNGHAVEDENNEQDFNRNPFRPISELTVSICCALVKMLYQLIDFIFIIIS